MTIVDGLDRPACVRLPAPAGIPRGFARSAALAKLPTKLISRAVISGARTKLSGAEADARQAELADRAAAEVFEVLGRLKGGAMKVGQSLSVFEAALPDRWIAPYREALTKLQDAVPPMSTKAHREVLARQFGASWESRFASFDPMPVAAASVGQVHRAVWADGRAVAVKIQYPGAGEALMGDYRQLARFARLFRFALPGLDLKPLLAELELRLAEELDYTLEADAQRAFAAAFRGDADIKIPDVVASAPCVLVTEWIDGTPMSQIITSGTQRERDAVGRRLSLFQFSAPQRCGLLHADTHPGNFRVLADGRLGVLDFGAVARLPGGMPEAVGRFTRLILDADATSIEGSMRSEGFVRPGHRPDVTAVIDFLRPIVEPLAVEDFTFTREWLARHASRLVSPGGDAATLCRTLNLPAQYLMLHRVTLGTLAILCQLGATAPYRQLAEQWQPGFTRGAL